VAVAGNKVTDDLRKGLGILHDQAERLKRQFGMALVDMVEEDREIHIPGIGGRPDKAIGQSTLAQIIQPRLEEILEFVGVEIRRSGYGRHLSAGVVLTGGGALIPGTAELAAEILGLEARVGRPLGLAGGLVEEVDDPKYATGVGLVLHGLRTGAAHGATPVLATAAEAVEARAHMLPPAPEMGDGDGHDDDPDNLVNKIAGRMRSWFDEL